MRVLLISHTCQSATEGQPRAHHLGLKRDVELRVLVPDRWKHYGQWRIPEMPSAGQPFEFSPGKIALPWVGPAQYYLSFYPQMASVLREFEPDIIDAWQEPWAAVTAQACFLRKRIVPNAKIICETEQNIAKDLPPPFENFRRYVLRRTDACVARSNEAVGVLRGKGFQGPITVVPNGVDTEKFRPLDRNVCRESLGLSGFVIGYVGRILEEKGVADLFDAVLQFKSPVTLLFVGSGKMEEKLKIRAMAAGIGDQVRMLPNQPHDRLPALMNAMDCLVLPSRTTERWKEQFGRVLIEAAACGTPVIGSSSGAIPGVIGDGGIVFPECDVNQLFAALDRLRQDPKYSRELGAIGRTQVEQRYSWNRVAEQFVDVYKRALSAKGTNEPADDEIPAPSASKPATSVVSSMSP